MPYSNLYNLTKIYTLVDNCILSPLIAAVKKGQTDLVRELIVNGADINEQDDNGDTALMWATKIGYKKIVEHLMSLDELIISKQNNEGYTALMLAAQYGRTQIAKQLIYDLFFVFSNFNDVNIKNNDGDTALMLAAKYGYSSIVKQLVQCYWEYLPLIELDLKNHNEDTALILAAANGHEQVVDILLGCDCIDLEANTNKNGDTALSVAMKNGYTDIAYKLACYFGYDKDLFMPEDNYLHYSPKFRR